LQGLLAPPSHDGLFHGVVIGVVTNNQDPDGMHRVKVRFPWLNDGDESHWARVVAPMAGPDRGAYFLPEADDEVLVAFEHGSLEHAYVIGALWNGQDKPPENNSDGRNDNRTLKSRSGHIIRMCDSDGDERLELIDKTGQNRVIIHSKDNKITIEAQGDIEITSSTGKVKIDAMAGVEITSKADVKIQAQTTVDMSATGQVNIKGSLVNVN
jgi:uncharacterized protein involved in type VI secretion and phage assembly